MHPKLSKDMRVLRSQSECGDGARVATAGRESKGTEEIEEDSFTELFTDVECRVDPMTLELWKLGKM